jgi:alpha-tubulin suppressor-like RCC1 family protein
MAGVRRLLANTFSSCAQGTISAVGKHERGQLGDGTQTGRSAAVAVVGLGQRAITVSADTQHSLFLLEDGSVKAVGANGNIQRHADTPTHPSSTHGAWLPLCIPQLVRRTAR